MKVKRVVLQKGYLFNITDAEGITTYHIAGNRWIAKKLHFFHLQKEEGACTIKQIDDEEKVKDLANKQRICLLSECLAMSRYYLRQYQ